jgi:hypothetical protein
MVIYLSYHLNSLSWYDIEGWNILIICQYIKLIYTDSAYPLNS